MARERRGLIQVKPPAQAAGKIRHRVQRTDPAAEQPFPGQGVQQGDDHRSGQRQRGGQMAAGEALQGHQRICQRHPVQQQAAAVVAVQDPHPQPGPAEEHPQNGKLAEATQNQPAVAAPPALFRLRFTPGIALTVCHRCPPASRSGSDGPAPLSPATAAGP